MVENTQEIVNSASNVGGTSVFSGVIIGIIIAVILTVVYKFLGKSKKCEASQTYQANKKSSQTKTSVPLSNTSKLRYSQKVNTNVMDMIDTLAEIYKTIE